MRKLRVICSILCIVLLCGLCSACGKEDTEDISGYVESSACRVAVSTDSLLKSSPLIFQGKVTAEGPGHYTNPDGSKTEGGYQMINQWLTPYTVQVLEVYKGDLRDDIHELTVAGFSPTSPEDYDPSFFSTGDSSISFEIGEIAVFCVTYSEENGCYEVIYNIDGIFHPSNEEGIYYGFCKDSIDIRTIREDIKNADPTDDVVGDCHDLHIKESDRAKVES